MSNAFKNNSRFASLADDISTKKENKKHNKGDKKETFEEKSNSFKSENNSLKRDNSFKNDGFRERRFNRYNTEYDLNRLREEREAQEKARKEEEDIRKQKNLTQDNFPDLVLNKRDTYLTQDNNYLEKLNNIKNLNDENADANSDLKKLTPGWILLETDNLTDKTIMNRKLSDIQKSEISEEEISTNVVNALVELHQRRTQEYIELNGYDTWEQKFKCTGWREWEKEVDDDSDEDYGESENSEEEYM